MNATIDDSISRSIADADALFIASASQRQKEELEPSEIAALARGSIRFPPASDEEIEQLASKLRTAPPTELVQLLKVANGFLFPSFGTGPARFLASGEIERLSTREASYFKLWCNLVTEVNEAKSVRPTTPHPVGSVYLPDLSTLASAYCISERRSGMLLVMAQEKSNWEFIRLSIHTDGGKDTSLFKLVSDILKE